MLIFSLLGWALLLEPPSHASPGGWQKVTPFHILQFIGHIKHTCISPDEITSCGPTFRPPSDPSLHLQYRQYWCPSSYSSAVSWPHNMTFFQTKIKQMFQHLRNTAKVLFPVLHLCTSTGLAEGSFRIVML